MLPKSNHHRWALETFLILVVGGLIALLYQTAGYKVVVLNLFYLPVVLAAFYLGRYVAGSLALFSVIAATAITVTDVGGFANYSSPIVIGLSMTVWGSVLGLTAILVGTLSDERNARTIELHEAYVGVVEVLARHLQSANSGLKQKSDRICGFCDAVAREMRLSEKEIDDIRVASLLQGIENIEITSRVIRKAMDDLGDECSDGKHTFHGSDLVHSLGGVLTSAFPLVLSQNSARHDGAEVGGSQADAPIGGSVIETVRAYDNLVAGPFSNLEDGHRKAIDELRSRTDAAYHPAVLHALEKIDANSPAPQYEPATKAPQLEEPVPVGV